MLTVPKQLETIARLAVTAGGAIMEIYDRDIEVRTKDDASPVTDADVAAERIILAGLTEVDPHTPVIAEEAVAAGLVPKAAPEFYLVDPLDGTREFISRNGEFTVNIALIRNGMPVLGVVYAPVLERLFAGDVTTGCFEAKTTPGNSFRPRNWKPIKASGKDKGPVRVVASRSHRDQRTDDWLAERDVSEIVSAGSSLKFCLLAAGEADLYPRFGRTMEWDTAAGHAVLAAAGGSVVMEDGTPLTYGKEARGFDNPAFIASGAGY